MSLNRRSAMRFPLADKEAEEEEEEEEALGEEEEESEEEEEEEEEARGEEEEESEEEEEEEEEARGGEEEESEEEEIIGGGGEEEAEQRDEQEDGRALTVRIDPDVLDCSVCFEPLRPRLYQCQNGHVMCSSCCRKLLDRCHVCSHSSGKIRCLTLEKVIESIKIPCSHATYGCKKTISYAQRDTHEESCIYAPCSCPIPDCTFHGPTKALSAHFKSQHINSLKSVGYYDQVEVSIERTMPFLVLCAEDDHYLFLLLNDYDVNRGNALSVVCLQPSASEMVFQCDLTISAKESTLNFTAVVKNIRQWKGVYPTDAFLLVPPDFCGPSQKIDLEVCVIQDKASLRISLGNISFCGV